MRNYVLAISLVLSATMGPSTWGLQTPPVDPVGTGTVSDGSTLTIATDITSATTYRVKNKGPDQKITVRRYNASGDEILPAIEVGNGSSTDVGVPQGGDLKVEDTDTTDSDPNNTLGASINYWSL